MIRQNSALLIVASPYRLFKGISRAESFRVRPTLLSVSLLQGPRERGKGAGSRIGKTSDLYPDEDDSRIVLIVDKIKRNQLVTKGAERLGAPIWQFLRPLCPRHSQAEEGVVSVQSDSKSHKTRKISRV